MYTCVRYYLLNGGSAIIFPGNAPETDLEYHLSECVWIIPVDEVINQLLEN